MQLIVFKGISIFYSFINPSTDIKTSYSFRDYHYLKNRVVLSLLSLFDIVCINTSYSIILYDSLFFQAQVFNTLIQKMATPIIIWGLRANKYAMKQYAISDIYILAKDSQKNW